jgi:hypothetical protein
MNTAAKAKPQQKPFVQFIKPQDALVTLASISEPVTATILDPWYNRGIGGVVPRYDDWLCNLVKATFDVSQHLYLWGFPDIVYRVLDHLPEGAELVAWLTWYYKNCPSVIRGWRSAQYTCLHIARKGAKLYPEHFLNEAQKQKQAEGKLRYLPGPPSVIEAPLNIGFVGKNEQTGHPSQKPVSVITPLIEMVTKPGDTVLDPMCGSGTTGVAAYRLGRNSILCDMSPEYMEITRKRMEAEMSSQPQSQSSPKKALKYASASLFSDSDAN